MCMGTIRKVVGGITGADKAKESADRAAAQMGELGAPGVEAQKYAFPRFKAAINQYLVPQAGKESPILARQHTYNLGRIGQTATRAKATARSYWERSGDIGRSRGEQLRIGQQELESRIGENLSYGGMQEGYKQGSIDRLLQGWAQLAGLGFQGVGLAAGGIKMGNQAAQDYYEGFGDFMGTLIGAGTGFAKSKYEADLARKMPV